MLKGLLKEVLQDVKLDDSKVADIAIAKEQSAKALEENKTLKAQLDSMQGKLITLNQNTGTKNYVFKGYDMNMRRNLVMDVSEDLRNSEAKKLIKALTEANTGAYATSVEYGNALLGLAEVSSVFLSKARILMSGSPIVKLPVKGTRATVDVQAFGTANAGAALDLVQLTFTVDKRIGGYEVLNNDLLADQTFDVIGQWVEPAIAEGIGQNIDGEVIKKTEFTTDLAAGATAGVTVSGAVAMAAAITYANLNTIRFTPELYRNLKPEWFMSQGAFAACAALTGTTNDHPILNAVPISNGVSYQLLGYTVNITPAMLNVPGTGNIRIAFGDPKQYIIVLRGGIEVIWNPWVSAKEGQTQVISWARADGNIVASAAWATLKRVDA